MSKQILRGLEAKETLLKGAEILADIVGSTLGPRGSNVAIDRGYDMIVIHDGVKVAKSIALKDNGLYAGVRILREAASKQVDEVGDGTTAVTILGHSIADECHKVVVAGIHEMSLRKGLEDASELVIKELTKLAKPVKTLEEKIQVATISAEEESLGKMIGEIVHKLGADGVITVEESKSNETFMEHQEGMQLDKGWISPYFVTDPERNEGTVESCYVLITDKELSNINEAMPLLEKVAKISKNLVIIAPEFGGSALSSFILTKINGGMNLLCIKAPQMGDVQKQVLQDIAILTGGVFITQDAGMSFDKVEVEQLGQAKRITATKDASIIVGGHGEKKHITERVAALREELDRAEGSEFQQEKLRERIAKLSSGVAVIKVGGHTDVEMNERKERADDAVHATQAAVSEGIILGGEIAYLQARRVLADSKDPAYRILYDALSKPFERLVSNAGMSAGTMMERLSTQSAGMGIDVTDGKIKDLYKVGIIDPVLVPKRAIRNSVSAAIMLMTTKSVVIPDIEEKMKADNAK